MEPSIPSYVKEANAQRDLYFSDSRFKKAQDLVLQAGVGYSTEDQENEIAGFLGLRKVKHTSSLEDLIKMEESKVVLFGAAFHFSRKFFTTSHDCGDDIQNPLPWIETVFDGVASFDNSHAARVLEDLSGLSSGEPYNQRTVVAAVSKVLPEIIEMYQKSLAQLGEKNREGSDQYKSEKNKLDKLQMGILDKFVGYVKNVLKLHTEIIFEKFQKYATLDNGAKENITLKYLSELLREQTIKSGKGATQDKIYSACLETINQQAGRIKAVSYHSHDTTPEAEIRFYNGQNGSNDYQSVRVHKDKDISTGFHQLILAVCDNILSTTNKSTSEWKITSNAKYMIGKWIKPK